jgi:parallel beta-helix repeat protein
MAKLSGNVISSNTADQIGGGLLLWGETAVCSGNTIISNTAVNNSGGGVALLRTRSTFSRNLVRGNVANGDWWFSGGGGLWIVGGEPVLTNNVIVDNRALSGSGLKIREGTLVSRHDTFARNSGGSGVSVITDPEGGGSDATFTNAILVGHSVGISVTEESSVIVNGVLWDSGTPITVSQSITASVVVQNQHTGDAAFAADGYHITGASAALDAGVNARVTTDFDGHHRPYGVSPDLGADEAIVSYVYVGLDSTLTYTDTNKSPTVILVPGGAVTESITIVFIPVEEVAAPVGLGFAGHAFDLDAYQDGTLRDGYVLSGTATVTVHYTDTDVFGVGEDALILAYWNKTAGAWKDAACGAYDRHPGENWLAVPICHLSRFALFGTQHDVYLPMALRNRQ